jgi:predicted ATPase
MVFTDIEGSTKLLKELGTAAYQQALARHRDLIRKVCRREEGYEVDYEGDAFFYAFSSAQQAVSAVSEAMAGLAEGPTRIRVGIHTGEPQLDPPKYVGMDVHLAARIMSAAHGGQILLSQQARDELEAGFELRHLGEHRLKDIEGPVAIFQLGDASFPPLKTISNTNLPRPASSFVGRERELGDVLAYIEGGARLVTLTGAGGSGKTRLAIEAAATLVPAYKAGVFWVGLAALRDPALVTETMAQTLGAKDGLAEHIGGREMLLLLDNLEQVIEAAPELSALLTSCPNLILLVTSRELLRLQGEVEYPVPPLAQPEAVSLFCERAQLDPSDEIAELCRRLDSLPLAVELAAARTKALSPAQILERLSKRLDLLQGGRDADPRQQTLRATIEWSYDLLLPEEQERFRRLAVFAGGCTLEAAEEVCDADLDTLQSLVEKNLLRFSNERYWMLETIREYAVQRLERSDNLDDLRRRHAVWFTDFAERELGHLGDAALVPASAAEVADDLDNLRTALTWCWARGRDDLGLRLGASATRYWCHSGHVQDAHAWLNEALPRIASANQDLQLEALKAASQVEFWNENLEAANRYDEQAMTLAEALDRPRDILWLTHNRAITLAERGDLSGAIAMLERNLASYRELGDQHGEALELHHLGELHRVAGNYARAAEFLSAAISLYRGEGDRVLLGLAVHCLGDVALDRDDLEEAARWYREALEVAQEPRGKIACLGGLACVLARRGRPREAATLWGAVSSTVERLGIHGFALDAGHYEKDLGSLRGTPEWMAGRELTLEEAVSLAQQYLR